MTLPDYPGAAQPPCLHHPARRFREFGRSVDTSQAVFEHEFTCDPLDEVAVLLAVDQPRETTRDVLCGLRQRFAVKRTNELFIPASLKTTPPCNVIGLLTDTAGLPIVTLPPNRRS